MNHGFRILIREVTDLGHQTSALLPFNSNSPLAPPFLPPGFTFFQQKIEKSAYFYLIYLISRYLHLYA